MQKGYRKRILNIVIFLLIFAGFAFILTVIPLLPAGLPLIISFLIAFITYKSPRLGMTLGCLLVGVSLLYHLARMNFMYILGEPQIRLLFILTIFLLFLVMPIGVETLEDALPISIGMISAGLLFFKQTFCLAIPLILVFATVYKKARIETSLFSYVLISFPLLILQYIKYGSQIERPPLYIPLDKLYADLQVKMSQFTFNEMFKMLLMIYESIMKPSPSLKELMSSKIINYLNSLPGIILFFVVLSGLISATFFFASQLASYINKIKIRTLRKYKNIIEPTFLIVTAACIIFIFWTLLDILQTPLNYKAEISSSYINFSIFGATVILSPISIADYLLKRGELIKARSVLLTRKAQEVRSRIDEFERLLRRIKKDLPIVIAPIERRVVLLRDDIDRIISSSSAGLYSLSELENEISNLDKILTGELDDLLKEIKGIVDEHYAHAFHRHILCISKLKDIGLKIKSQEKIVDPKEFQEEDMDSKIDHFKRLLDVGYSLVDEATQLYSKIYDITRSLYDPRLPADSPTLAIVNQKVEEKADPWEILDSICTSLFNLDKQYSAEISKSINNLRDSLNSITNLISRRESLMPVLGNSLHEIIEYANKAKSIQIGFETKELNVMKVVMVKETLDSILNISKNLLQVFYRELKRKEKMISDILPIEDYDWGKNVSLSERMKEAIDVTSNPSKYDVSRLTRVLYRSFSYFEECIGTLDLYNQQYEFLLNYIVAEFIIDELLKQKKQVYAHELPFDPRYSEEYLRIYFRQRYTKLLFDEESKMVMKRD